MKHCLSEVAKSCVIIVYTASHQSYADSVLDTIDPNKDYIKYRLYRHNCVEVDMEGEKFYIKDLRILRNVEIKNMVIIDNSIMSFAFQLENGIPILPYYDNPEDSELNFLINYINYITKFDDIRIPNMDKIKMDYFLNAAKEDIGSSEETSILSEIQNSNLLILKHCSNAYNTNSGYSSSNNEMSSYSGNISEYELNIKNNKNKNQSSQFKRNSEEDNHNIYKTETVVNNLSFNGKQTLFQEKLSLILDELKTDFSKKD